MSNSTFQLGFCEESRTKIQELGGKDRLVKCAKGRNELFSVQVHALAHSSLGAPYQGENE